MAEALCNARLSNQWLVFSTGTEPAGYIHPKAIAALAEIGIKHEGESKHMDDFHNADLDLVITVCDDAAEICPVWLGSGERVHIGFPDPANVEGTDEEILTVFRAVRDDIEQKVIVLLISHGINH